MRTNPSSARLALVAMLCVVGLTKQAAATVTIALEWGACGGGAGCTTATGSSHIGVDIGGGQTLRLDIFLSHDLPQGLVGHSFSLNFDTDLLNELNLGPMAPVEWAGTDLDPGLAVKMYAPYDGTPSLLVESGTGSSAGRISSFESFALVGSLPANGVAYTVGTFSATAPARYRVGQAYFTVSQAMTDGVDVFAGLFSPADAFVDGDGLEVPPGAIVIGTAILNLVPEPGTLSLLGLGLVGLVLAARRSRRARPGRGTAKRRSAAPRVEIDRRERSVV